MPSGAESLLALALQSENISDGGTPDIGLIYPVRPRFVRPSAGRVLDQGEPEIGGALYTGTTTDVVGILPSIEGQARARLGAIFHLLTAAGFTPVVTAGPPAFVTWTPEPTGASWRYLFALARHGGAGDKYRFVDGRTVQFALRSRPRQPVLIDFRTAFQDMLKSSATIESADFSTQRVLHNSVPETGGSAQLLGVDTAIYTTDFVVDNTFDFDGHPVGARILEDIPPVAQVVTIGMTIKFTDDFYERFDMGSLNASQVDVPIASGAFRYRLSTPADVGVGPNYDIKGHVHISGTADIYLAQPVEMNPQRQTLLPLTIRCTSGLAVQLLNGTDCTAFTNTSAGTIA